MYVKILGAAVNAAILAYHLVENGHKVLWKTYDDQLMLQLTQNELLFDDYQLSYAIRQHIMTGRLCFDDINNEERYTICVFAVNNQQSTNFEQFSDHFQQHYDLVINYSNLGFGITKRIQNIFKINHLIYIPDFIQENQYVQSFLTKGFIIGCDDDTLIDLIKELFYSVFDSVKPLHFMSVQAAEFTKLSVSGFLATKISFMNDLSNVAESLNIDINEVRIAMSMDERIGGQYLFSGCGFGGNNFSRDILKLKEVVLETGNVNGLLDKIWDINENQKEIVFRKVWKLFNCDLRDKVIAIWGAAFKPNTNSVANAPILKVLEACWSQGAITQVHDPRALLKLKELYPNQDLLKICSDPYQAAEGADVLCLMTEWKQYCNPDYHQLAEVMKQKNIIDGRNVYHPAYVRKQGFNYIGIGR